MGDDSKDKSSSGAGGSTGSSQVMMRTPSGKLVPFDKWIAKMRLMNLTNDIKKMLVLINKEVIRLSSARVQDKAGNMVVHPDARAALEQTYFMLLVLVADTSRPIPVDDEVEEGGGK